MSLAVGNAAIVSAVAAPAAGLAHAANASASAALFSPHALLVLRATALLLLTFGATSTILEVGLRLTCGVMLVVPALLVSWRLWLGIVTIVTYVNLSQWHSIDNHKYLISYWTLACCLAVSNPVTAEATLRRNARLMIGLCFLFAVVWKFYAGQYLDGSFLRHTFMTDSRIALPTALLTGVPLASLDANRAMVGFLASWPSDGRAVTLASNETLRTVAVAASYWTLLIEGSVALLWLRRPNVPAVARDIALIMFIATTYVLLPVVGFATALGLLGLAATGADRPRMRITYLLLLLAIQLTAIPWESYVTDLLFNPIASPPPHTS